MARAPRTSEGKANDERAAHPDLGLKVDLTMMLLHHDGVAIGQPMAGSFALRPGGEERLEEPRAVLLGNAGTVVGDAESGLVIVAMDGDPDPVGSNHRDEAQNPSR